MEQANKENKQPGNAGQTDDEPLNVSEMPEHWKHQEDVVITGVSGRFPESDDMAEFEHNLMNGYDMITEDERRRPFGFAGLPRRHGKLKDLSKFDAQAFGVTPKQASAMDPALRILLEVAYEAIADSGINPLSMRGSKIGVFSGVSISESALADTDPDKVDGYGLLGSDTTMYANRLSYYFGFVGPSFPVNTACSSSLLALHIALQNIRDGLCDGALVCGAHLNMLPAPALQIHRLNMSGRDGACRSFDSSGIGYCRTEAVAAIFLQRKSNSRRIYASVVHTKTNSDGFKEQGITFPSGEQQFVLLREFYSECKVDPNQVSFVEAHGTGTPVGDPQEGNSICRLFCRKDRKEPLLLGSVKSNMGHAEPAAGLVQVAKVILAMERGFIPPNLHFKAPNPNIPGLLDGRMKVVSEKTPWKGGYAAINSFGFGGANVHCLLKSADITSADATELNVQYPRLVCHAGRTEESVKHVFQCLKDHSDKISLQTLLGEISRSPPSFMGYRGYTILKQDGTSIEAIEKMGERSNDKPPIWFIYSGMGSQWNGMGKDLMQLKTFRETIDKCAKALKPHDVDLISLLTDLSVDVVDNTLNSFVSVAAIQIALTDVLSEVGIEPDGIIGHSFGEVACGYADQCLTAEQAILVAYWRGQCIQDGNLAPGAMAAVGLTWEEAQQKCPSDIYPACHNANDSVTISGPPKSIDAFVEKLHMDEVFAKKVKSTGVAFHSRYLHSVVETMKTKIQTVIQESKPRSSRWVSTSVSSKDPNNNLGSLSTASADYYVNNLVVPVIFYDAVSTIPNDAVIIEVAPHALLQAVIKRSVKSTNMSLSLMNARKNDQMNELLTSLGKLYCSGINVSPHKLYAKAPFPVPRNTPMIGPLIKWDHSSSWAVADIKQLYGKNSGATSFNINPYDLEKPENKYLLEHVIDGKALFPMAGFMEIAWKALAKQLGKDFQKTPVVLEDVRLFRATNLKEEVTFDVYMTPGDPEFRILDGTDVILSGRIQVLEDGLPMFYDSIDQESALITDCKEIPLDRNDIYKQIRIRGYEYGPMFQGIYSSCNCGHETQLEWTGKWTSFIDSMTQTTLLRERDNKHLLPIRLRYLRIDPMKHLAQIRDDAASGKKLMSCYSDADSNGIKCGGIELRELVVQSMPRRPPPIHTVSLENKYFIPYYDDNCFQDFPVLRETLGTYNSMVSEFSKKALARCVMKHSKRPPLSPSHSPNRITESRRSNTSALRESTIANKNQVIGQILLKVSEAESEAEQRNIALTMLPALKEDMLWTATWQNRALMPVVEFVQHNTIGKLLTIAQLAVVNPKAQSEGKKVFGKVLYIAQIGARDDGFLSKCAELISRNPQMATSNAFINCEKTAAVLEESKPTLNAETFVMDIEDPEAKTPEALANSQDLVVLEKYLYRSKDPKRVLETVKSILSSQGFLIVSEITENFEAMEIIDFLRGFTNEDSSGGPYNGDNNGNGNQYSIFYNYSSHEEWCELFENAGYDLISYQQDATVSWGTNYLLRPKRVPTKPTMINIDDIHNFTWIHQIQEAMENIANGPPNENVWLMSDNPENGLNGLILCFKDESMRPLRFRMIQDTRRPHEKSKPLGKEAIDNRLKQDVLINIFRKGMWGADMHMPVEKTQQRTKKSTEFAFLHPLQAGNLSSITWIESASQYWGKRPHMYPDEILCSVYYGALNFRDVMLATGRLSPDAIPGKTLDREYMVGFEFAGRESATGKRIMGITAAQALATTVSARQSSCWNVPDSWSLKDAATIPVVYLTTYYALIMRGNLQPEDSILIHAGSGGVGQAAIRVALAKGCEVFTTVGSTVKRNFLLETFPDLKPENIGDSRSTSFELMIMKRTKGRGVDLVLNSLSDEKLQASIRCLAVNGKFLEIGKYDLQNNTPAGLGVLLKNVNVCGIVLEHVFGKAFQRNKQLVMEGIASGVVKPLKAHTFDSDQCEDAFRFMSQGKHMGKVLIKIREEESEITALPQPLSVSAVTRTFPNPEHVFLITGGLGGFGLEIADWLVGRGVAKLILTSRSGAKLGYQKRLLDAWSKKGVTVTIMNHDISNLENTRELIKDCQKIGPIGGIMHLAMVLRDALFENQTVDNFKETSQQKVWGTKNLDIATRELCDENLKWFIAFSSVASGKGHKGQTCYGWANSAMENIVVQRRKDGFCGQVIEWGAIGDVGVVIQHLGDNTTVVGGTLPQRIYSCLETMDVIVNSNQTIVSSFVRNPIEITQGGGGPKSGELLDKIGRIFGVSSSNELDSDARFGELGLDSLMGVEIREAIEKDFEISLSVKDVRMLTINKIHSLIAGDTSAVLSDKDNSNAEKDTNIMNLYGLRCTANELKPTDPCIKLNDSTNGSPIFCVHSFEGIASNLRYLASLLKNPFYCFQCTPEVPADSIESLAAHYIEQMKKIQQKGPYTIAGYSLGVTIAIELACQLEAAGEEVIDVIALDSSQLYPAYYGKRMKAHYNDVDHFMETPMYQCELLSGFTVRFCDIDTNEMGKELMQLPDWNARLDQVVKTVMEKGDGKFDSPDTVVFAAQTVKEKFAAADKYSFKHNKLSCPIFLIRASDGIMKVNKAGENYGLDQITSGEVKVSVVKGDHDSFIHDAPGSEVALLIDQYLAKH